MEGTVRDNTDETVAFANVYLLQLSDSSLVKGASSDENGHFTISNVPPAVYYISASYVGQASPFVPIDVLADTQAGTLIIQNSTTALDEVVVTSKKPTVQRKTDRLIFQVENTVVSQGSSWDILKRTPGVIMVQDELQVKGQTPTIYLNNHKVHLSQSEVLDLLQGLSGTNIQSVEVIPNPPASYDAEGGPILNIVTSKSVVAGYKGSVNGTYTQSVYPKYTLGTSHYFKTEKLNLFANYGINPKKEWRNSLSFIHYKDGNNQTYSSWDTDYVRTSKEFAHSANMILDYALDDRNSLNLTANGTLSPNQDFDHHLTGEIRNGAGQLDSTLTTNSSTGSDDHNLGGDLSFVHQFKKAGESLSFNGHYTNYKETKAQQVLTEYEDANGQFLRNFGFASDAEQQIDILTGQLDYTLPLGSSTFKLGSKVSHINSDSSIDFFGISGTSDSFDTDLSNNFEYRERVYAGYASFGHEWTKWSLQTGLRGEYTDVEGTSLTLGQTNAQKYFELFPTAHLVYAASDKHSFSANYSRKLDRPRYEDLNPFPYFVNENDYTQGNPTLRPYFTQQFKFNYTYNSEYFFDLYYRDNGHYISALAFQDNAAQVMRTVQQNVVESHSYGLDFTVSKSLLPVWYLYLYTSFFHEDETFLAQESGNQEATNEVNGIYGYWANFLTLSKDGTLSGEVGLTYFSRYLEGSYTMHESTNLSVGLKKTLWKNRATLSITAEDLFKTSNPLNTSQYLNQDNGYRPISENRFVRVGFTYNFGNFRLQDNEKEISNDERERL